MIEILDPGSEWKVELPSDHCLLDRLLVAREGDVAMKTWLYDVAWGWADLDGVPLLYEDIVWLCGRRGWTLHSLPAAEPETETGVRGDG